MTKLKLSLSIICLGWACLSMAKTTLPELLEQLQGASEDTVKVWLLHDLGFKYSIKNTDSSQYYLENALLLSRKLDYPKGIIHSLHRLSYFQKMAGNLENEEQLALEALEMAQKYNQPDYLGKGYKHLGDIARDKLLLDSAFHYYTLAIEHYEKYDSEYNSFIVYLDLHRVFLQRGQTEKAEKQLLKAYELTKPKAIRKDYGLALYMLVNFYFKTEQWDKYAKFAEIYVRFLQGADPDFSKNLYHQAIFYFNDNSPDSNKEELIEKLIEKHQESNNTYSLISSYLELYRIHFSNNKSGEAINALKKALQLAETIPSMTSIAGFCEMLAEQYDAQGNPGEAFPYLKRATIINDSLNSVATQKNMDELNVRFETAKKEETLARQQLELERQASEKRLAWMFAVSASLVALIIAWFLFFKSKTNKKLIAQKKLIEKSLAEKEVLLREIHHRVKNNLQVISSLLNWQSKFVKDSRAKSAIREGRNRVKSMALIHQNLYQKENLTAVNVAEYIENLSINLFDSYNIQTQKIQFQSEIDPVDLDVDVLIPLGLILNELISNALKHAFPDDRQGTVSVKFKQESHQLLLKVTDNGVGMSEKARKAKKESFGYELIETFVAKLKASMKVRHEKGTSIQLVIPTANPPL